MILRARWRGPLPEVGDYLRTSRSLYLITGVKTSTAERARYVGAEPGDGDERRATLEVERVEYRVTDVPGAHTYPFRWDARGRRRPQRFPA